VTCLIKKLRLSLLVRYAAVVHDIFIAAGLDSLLSSGEILTSTLFAVAQGARAVPAENFEQKELHNMLLLV